MFIYHFKLFKKFGIQSILFLLKSKFKKNKLENRIIKGVIHPIHVSNYGPDVMTLFQIFFGNEYKIPFYINPTTIIDCGANIGLSAVYYANAYPNARIIALEPDKTNFKYLKKNAENYSNIICINKAVWSQRANMEIIDIGTGNWSLQTKESLNSNENTFSAISISDIMYEYGIDNIDILKIDIEGAEKELFTNNYNNWITRTKCIAIELHDNIHPGTSDAFNNAISGLNYEKYFIGENVICDLKAH